MRTCLHIFEALYEETEWGNISKGLKKTEGARINSIDTDQFLNIKQMSQSWAKCMIHSLNGTMGNEQPGSLWRHTRKFYTLVIIHGRLYIGCLKSLQINFLEYIYMYIIYLLYIYIQIYTTTRHPSCWEIRCFSDVKNKWQPMEDTTISQRLSGLSTGLSN